MPTERRRGLVILRAASIAAAMVSCAPAMAQVSKSTLQSNVSTTFPDNTTGSITPANVRSFLDNLINSYQQYFGVNPQVGASYTFGTPDYGQLVTFNNSNPVAVSLPSPQTAGFGTYNVAVRDLGAGTVTITPTNGATINGQSTLTVSQGQFAWVVSDGTNYQLGDAPSASVACAGLPALTGDVTSSAASCATTLAKIQGTTVTGTTGSGAAVLGTSPTIASPTLSGTAAAVNETVSGTFAATGTSAASLSNGTQTLYASATNGGVYSGQGSSNDVTLANKSGVLAANVPTGTTNFNVASTLTFGTLSSASLAASPSTVTGLTVNNSPSPSNDYFLYYNAASGMIERCTVGACSSAATAGVSSLNGLTGGLSIVAGAGAAVSAGGSSITISGFVPPPGGRITLVTATPVLVSNQTAKGTLFYDCYNGNPYVPYYNGTTDILDTVAGCEVSDAMVSAASAGQVVSGQVYDLWWVHGGANRICLAMSSSTGGGGGWASDTGGSNTARGSGYSQLDKTTRPYITNANSIANCFNAANNYGPVSVNQGTYLGTIFATANGQTGMNFTPAAASGGSGNILGVYNAYNRVDVVAVELDNNNGYTLAGTTWRKADNSASTSISYVDGLGQSNTEASVTTTCQENSGTAGCAIGVVLDWSSGAPTNAAAFESTTNTQITSITASASFLPVVGFHVLNHVEAGVTAGAGLFNQALGIAQSLTAKLRM